MVSSVSPSTTEYEYHNQYTEPVTDGQQQQSRNCSRKCLSSTLGPNWANERFKIKKDSLQFYCIVCTRFLVLKVRLFGNLDNKLALHKCAHILVIHTHQNRFFSVFIGTGEKENQVPAFSRSCIFSRPVLRLNITMRSIVTTLQTSKQCTCRRHLRCWAQTRLSLCRY